MSAKHFTIEVFAPKWLGCDDLFVQVNWHLADKPTQGFCHTVGKTDAYGIVHGKIDGENVVIESFEVRDQIFPVSVDQNSQPFFELRLKDK